METIHIIDSKEPITKGYSFTFHEFFKPTYGGGIEFDIPVPLVDAMQWLRNYFNMKWLITSTIRPNDKFGFHVTGYAIDSIPLELNKRLDVLNQYKQECLQYQETGKSELIENLREKGVNGFMIEGQNCIHLDVRDENNPHLVASKDKYGKYIVCFWSPSSTSTNGINQVVYQSKNFKQ